ncbi:DUF4917 family protein [Daejeonella oryzae]|uniref:DUF4917 family protein n=1 Tax=Daejeonella oryzae TaxID=1122943 RepID=UPI0004231625|nr:DUF4917 family protein [Daejeonella oryzae]
MLSNKQLESIGISQWPDYGNTFDNTDIFIGNGFSINLFQALSYNSLFTKFSEDCGSDVIKLFKAFNTSNFEYVMEALNNTQHVGTILGLDYSAISPVVERLKEGLIRTIGETHPLYRDVNPSIFRSLAVDFMPFRNIFTTNYDVFLYKIILANNNLIDLKLIQSASFQDEFYVDMGKHRLGIGDDYENCRKIYYLHGALFLYHDRGMTYKFRKGGEDDEYIRMLRMEIANGNIPLFVCEGKPDDKFNAINNNYYLRSCGNALKKNDKSDLVVYGSAFQSSDKHIVDWINQANPNNLITSLYVHDKSEESLKSEISRITNLFGNISVSFYDSTSLFSFSEKHKF